MRQRIIGGTLLVAAVLAAAPSLGRAQEGPGFQPPGSTSPTLPIPTGGGPGDTAGFYGAMEFIFLTQTRAIGDQTVAFRGLVDSTGRITQLPGTYIGSQQAALTTNNLGRTNYFPGFNIEIGYKFEDGTKLYASYMQLFQSNYTDGATLATPFARSRTDLSDTFLTAGVFNFSPQFSGPRVKTGYDIQTLPRTPQNFNPGYNTYGIWNGASTMDIKFSERFTGADIGMRTPIFQTEMSRVYALAGGRYAWFFERFTWRTADVDINGLSTPADAATYTNTLSQRMYGPFIGCGHEIYAGNAFSCSLDLTAAGLLGVVKDRTKYELGDESTQSKRGLNMFDVVPNVNANLNVWWYPVEGVQIRVGYQAQTYFNTKYMREPIGFNFDAPDPAIDTKYFRLLHGINVGLGLFF